MEVLHGKRHRDRSQETAGGSLAGELESTAAYRLGIDIGSGWEVPGRSLGLKVLNGPLTLQR
jgi:hypothetical protein